MAKRAMGRGLSALLEDMAVPATVSGPGVASIAIADITANPGQPRRHFDADALMELVASIRTHGVLQPIVVRPDGAGRYQIVAGERRWRAAQAAGLHEVPAVVRALDDRQTQEIALIENIQRSDLNAMEEARAYRRLMADFGHTQQVLADGLGKSRSHVANMLRLLELPEAVQALVADGSLAMGHARAVANAPDPLALARRAVREGLSVRAVEKLAAGARQQPRHPAAAMAAPANDANAEALELQLAEQLGMPVALQVSPGGNSGSLTIRFASLDQLDDICSRLNRT